ncbi:hypothetical protein ES332_A04G075700v1 [Gossypium tomentosum]|uniref:Uncharacterized protein n=1 Tax=Gossypium tomentosum TaxID=34277 RepID=A0A5D2QVG1_GOSTO|nr:hypothetical protein ES332_A04G075700v1 [Gossypium tomentosum]
MHRIKIQEVKPAPYKQYPEFELCIFVNPLISCIPYQPQSTHHRPRNRTSIHNENIKQPIVKRNLENSLGQVICSSSQTLETEGKSRKMCSRVSADAKHNGHNEEARIFLL